MTMFVPALLPVCGAVAALPPALCDAALALPPTEDADPMDVDRDLRCILQAHSGGDHQALVRELPGAGGGSVWAAWSDTRLRPT